MILKHDIKRVLCFGDSNTWGQSDDKNHASRYELEVRWPGKIQKLLGERFEVYEEGLGGRNTTFEHYDSKKAFRNGIDYFIPYLQSHDKFDLVIMMLGTNDLKIQYNRSSDEVALGVEEYVNYVKSNRPETLILLLGPPTIDSGARLFDSYYSDTYDSISAEKSRKLGIDLENLAKKHKIKYLNTANIVSPGRDGIHLTEDGHALLAEAISSKIKEMLK